MALTRRGRLTVTLSVAALLVAALVLLLTRTRLGSAVGLGTAPPCTLTTPTGEVEWSTVQAMTATTVSCVGNRIGATENGVAAAVRRSLAVERTDSIWFGEPMRAVWSSVSSSRAPAAGTGHAAS